MFMLHAVICMANLGLTFCHNVIIFQLISLIHDTVTCLMIQVLWEVRCIQ
jgi:hypothetical protein